MLPKQCILNDLFDFAEVFSIRDFALFFCPEAYHWIVINEIVDKPQQMQLTLFGLFTIVGRHKIGELFQAYHPLSTNLTEGILQENTAFFRLPINGNLQWSRKIFVVFVCRLGDFWLMWGSDAILLIFLPLLAFFMFSPAAHLFIQIFKIIQAGIFRKISDFDSQVWRADEGWSRCFDFFH